MEKHFNRLNERPHYDNNMSYLLSKLFGEKKSHKKLTEALLKYWYRKVDLFSDSDECENRIRWLNFNQKEYVYWYIYNWIKFEWCMLLEKTLLAADVVKIIEIDAPEIFSFDKEMEKDIQFTKEGVYHIHTMNKETFNRIYFIWNFIKKTITKKNVNLNDIKVLFKNNYACMKWLNVDQISAVRNIYLTTNQNIQSEKMTNKLLLESWLTPEIVRALES